MPSAVRVVSFGLGPIGLAAARLALQKTSIQLVGAIDIDPKKVGQDLGELLELGRPTGVLVEADAEQALQRLKPDVMLHCTSSFLPMVKDTQRLQLLKDRYVVLLRAGHPFARKRRTGKALLEALRELEFVGVRSHADTLRIVQQLRLESRMRLVTEHFMVLPAIVAATDLAAVMPRNIARGFEGGYAIVEPEFPQRDFVVALHWSRRFESDPGNRWLRGVIETLFRE